MRIFVSYTTRDKYINLTRLRDVFSVMSQFGLVYIDLLHNDSQDRQRRVENELALSSTVVFLKTPAVSKSVWFMKETKLAVQQQKKCLEIDIDNTMKWADTLKHIQLSMVSDLQPTSG